MMHKTKRGRVRIITFVTILTLILISMPFSTVQAETAVNTAQQVVNDMGAGWNLGNTLDSYNLDLNAYNIAQQKRDKYQMMATYSTKYYSGWDASGVPYFSSSSSECTLTWNITKLNSAMNQPCGKFAFQIINHGLKDSGEDTLDFTVTKAQFYTAGGITYTLSDMLGTFSKTIKNDVTTYVTSDLSKISQLATTANILGGTLSITVKINDYPMPKVASTTKEAYFESLWGNPTTTKSMIDMVKSAGFGAVRIPITYYNHMDEQGNIDAAWMARIATVVQYVLDNDMYCIINMHHDTGEKGWLKADTNTFDVSEVKFAHAWSQIAGYFKDYDQKLLFEGYNELLNDSNQWIYAGSDAYDAANQLNQSFVDTVRSSGGNNVNRCLLVSTYAASSEQEILDAFLLPTDSAQNCLIAEVHYYGSTQSAIKSTLERLNNTLIKSGTPVVIGECGTTWETPLADRVNCATYIASNAAQYDIACFWWDDGNYTNKAGAKSKYALLDRYAMTWYYPTIVEAFVSATAN